jgi:HK97 gp10 family phage protein
MEIQIKLLNAKELAAAFRKAPSIAIKEFGKAIGKTAFKIEGDAKRKAPVNKESGGGNLRQSISSRTSSASAVVAATAKYAAYVDQGTRPHTINVVNSRVLANKRTGQFFGRVVHHPGTRKQPFFTDAVEGNQDFFNNTMTSALQSVLNSIH